MASKLIPSDPEKVMVIRRITPDILTLSTPFLRFGRIKIGGRGTVVRMQTGALAVFSPVALTDTVKAELQSLSPNGQVKYITALDQEHHIFLESWHKAYPQATVIAPDSLPGLRAKQGYFTLPDSVLRLFHTGDGDDGGKKLSVDADFDREFDMEYVHSHANKELVFNHKPSRTLIEADLIFNLPATEQMSRTKESPTSGYLTKLFTYFQNTHGKALGQKRFIWYLASSGDRPSFNRSMSRIEGWDFDKIIPCHGDVIEKDGKGIFKNVMQWHLEAKNKSK